MFDCIINSLQNTFLKSTRKYLSKFVNWFEFSICHWGDWDQWCDWGQPVVSVLNLEQLFVRLIIPVVHLTLSIWCANQWTGFRMIGTFVMKVWWPCQMLVFTHRLSIYLMSIDFDIAFALPTGFVLCFNGFLSCFEFFFSYGDIIYNTG